MNANIDAAGQQGLVDLLGKNALATDVGKGGVFFLAAIAAGRKHLNLDTVVGHTMGLRQQIAHQFGLSKRQWAAACSDPGEWGGRLHNQAVLVYAIGSIWSRPVRRDRASASHHSGH